MAAKKPKVKATSKRGAPKSKATVKTNTKARAAKAKASAAKAKASGAKTKASGAKTQAAAAKTKAKASGAKTQAAAAKTKATGTKTKANGAKTKAKGMGTVRAKASVAQPKPRATPRTKTRAQSEPGALPQPSDSVSAQPESGSETATETKKGPLARLAGGVGNLFARMTGKKSPGTEDTPPPDQGQTPSADQTIELATGDILSVADAPPPTPRPKAKA